ncbi:m04 protein [Murid betaherpesvirus 1]|uniref:M04 protein n=1 Tax=Murid herpesvirus 1 TaxID=10366 RepID=H2A161_MUHV1|nr:m04 protein [Murid betaherpesvirus 1]
MSLGCRLMLVMVFVLSILHISIQNKNECEKLMKESRERMKYRRPLDCYFKRIDPSKTTTEGTDGTTLTCTLPVVQVNASWEVEWVVEKLHASVDTVGYYESSPSSGPKFKRTYFNYTPMNGLSERYKANTPVGVKNGFRVDNSSTSGGNLHVYSNATEGSVDSIKCRLKMCPWTSDETMKTPDEAMLKKMSEVLNLPNYGVPDLTPPRRDEFYTKNESPNTIVTTLTVIVTLLYVVGFCLLAYVFGPSLYRRFFSNDCCSNFKPLKSN